MEDRIPDTYGHTKIKTWLRINRMRFGESSRYM